MPCHTQLRSQYRRPSLFGILLGMLVVSGCDCAGERGRDGGGAGLDGGGGCDGPAACDGGTRSDGGDDAGAVLDAGGDAGSGSAAEFCVARARARCAREGGCGYLEAARTPLCAARLEAECLAQLARVEGLASLLDGPAADACVAAIAAHRCIEGPLTEPGQCALTRLLLANSSVGERCADTLDCLDGACFGGARECRTCRAFAALRTPCNLTSQRCAPSEAFCGTPADGGVADCEPLRADGTVCASDRECGTGHCAWKSQVPDAGPDRCGRELTGAPCGDSSDCEATAYCRGFWFDGVTVIPGTCTARLPLGHLCINELDDDGCADGGTCLEGACGLVSPYSLDGGAECEGPGQCVESTYCRDFDAHLPDGGPGFRSGRCSARLFPGSPCSYSRYADDDCEAGTTCGWSATCVTRQPASGRCFAGYECQDLLSCPPSTQHCEPFHEVGLPCSAEDHCIDGAGEATCALDGGEGTCVARLPSGSPCAPTAPDTCASSRCFASDAGTAICQSACLP